MCKGIGLCGFTPQSLWVKWIEVNREVLRRQHRAQVPLLCLTDQTRPSAGGMVHLGGGDDMILYPGLAWWHRHNKQNDATTPGESQRLMPNLQEGINFV